MHRLSAETAYRATLAILVGIHLVLIWALPVMPGQDFPQHLSYVRILVDYGDPALPYRELYAVAAKPQPYFTTYLLMAAIAPHTGVIEAFRILLSLYVIATLLGFHWLVVAAHRHAREPAPTPPWTGLLGACLVWSPVACMGFLSFMLAVPVIVAGTATWLVHIETRSRRAHLVALACCSALLVSLHPVAAGCFLFISLLVVAFAGAPRPWRACGVVTGTMLITHLAWSVVGTAGVGSWSRIRDASEAMREAHGLEVIDKLLGLEWSSPLTKASYVLWTLLGPYRWSGLLLMAAMALVLVVCAWLVRHRRASDGDALPPATAARAVHKRLAVGVALLALIAPWGLYVPSEITFLNFRIMTIAFAIALALPRPAWFHRGIARLALIGFCLLGAAHFAYRAVGFNREAAAALRLEERAVPRGVMMSLPFHNATDHFAKQFRLTHFLPMYYTVLQRGVNTQFWARYTDHLPVGYRYGKRPRHTTDWSPWEYGPADLVDSDYVLLQRADDSDPKRMREGAAFAKEHLDRFANRVACDGLWCLYRLR